MDTGASGVSQIADNTDFSTDSVSIAGENASATNPFANQMMDQVRPGETLGSGWRNGRPWWTRRPRRPGRTW